MGKKAMATFIIALVASFILGLLNLTRVIHLSDPVLALIPILVWLGAMILSTLSKAVFR